MIKTDRLEVNIVRHCNNSCAYCNHGSPVADKYLMPKEVLVRDLGAMAKLMHTTTCCLQGGEPLLHPGIAELIDAMVASGIADQYMILSNGILLSKMTDDFWSRLGKYKMLLRLTLYPNQKWVNGLEVAKSKVAQFGFALETYHSDSFFKMLKPVPDDGRATFLACPWNHCHTVHDGWFYHCPLTTFFPIQFLGLPERIDGLALEGLTEAKLADFLSMKATPKTCGSCTGAQCGKVDWHETFNRESWLKEMKGA